MRLVSDHQAYLTPSTFDDVMLARELCHAHGVLMALQGLALPVADSQRNVLWVQAGSAWGSLLPLADSGLWRVDAGCQIAVMQSARLVGRDVPDGVQNLAQWFALALRHVPLTSAGWVNRIVSVDWLLPDGTIEVFGAFGPSDAQPLVSLRAQQVVPKLFELSARKDVCEVMDSEHWSMRFHLDALCAVDGVNLGHFFLGHGGCLGWLVAATFRQESTEQGEMPAFGGRVSDCRDELDQMVKHVIDPEGVFLSLTEQKG